MEHVVLTVTNLARFGGIEICPTSTMYKFSMLFCREEQSTQSTYANGVSIYCLHEPIIYIM